MQLNARRLDGSTYLSGAVEARMTLEELPTEKLSLKDLTRDGIDGIFNGPRFPRQYVNDPEHGVPFLGSTDILAADLSRLALLSKTQVAEKPQLLVDEGWILITCSGTIGRMAYARSDMEGMAGSQHFMRVIPDESKIKPGFLYAFLRSKFGIPLVTSGTYGAIIQHIEPIHIKGLPVPMARDRFQEQVHSLVLRAARSRALASETLSSAVYRLELAAGLERLSTYDSDRSPDINTTSAKMLRHRMDALYHSNYHTSVLEPLQSLEPSMRKLVGELTEKIFEPTRLKRIKVGDERFGIPFFGTSALMWAEPKASFMISSFSAGITDYVVDDKTVLIPRSGQLNGIIGHAVIPFGEILHGAVTEDAIRVTAKTNVLAGYLFVALTSEYGRRQLKARAFGSSIPHLNVAMISEVTVPWLSAEEVESVGASGVKVASLRDEAIEMEREAIAMVETWIEREAAENGS